MISIGVFAALNVAAAASGAVFKPGAWYASLNKPVWTPPNWAFPVVWTALFALNTVSGWLVWKDAGTGAAIALSVYAASLGLNAAWSALFFGKKRMDWAMIDVVALAASIALVSILFWPIDRTAALLQLPYLAWVLLAALLNWRMLQLNPRATAGRAS